MGLVKLRGRRIGVDNALLQANLHLIGGKVSIPTATAFYRQAALERAEELLPGARRDDLIVTAETASAIVNRAFRRDESLTLE